MAPYQEQYPVSSSNLNSLIEADAVWVAPLAAAKVVTDLEQRGPLGIASISHAEIPSSESGPQFQDRWAAVLFLLNVLAIGGIAVHKILYSDEMEFNFVPLPVFSIMPDVTLTYFLKVLGVTLVVTAIAGTIWLGILVRYPDKLIQGTLLGAVACSLSAMLLSIFVWQSIVGALLFGLMSLGQIWYYTSVQPRIPFASAVLSTAAKAISAHCVGLAAASLVTLALQTLWVLIWVLALFGVSDWYQGPVSGHSEGDRQRGVLPSSVLFALLLSFYWGTQVIKSVMQSTVAGTVGCWWFQPLRQAAVRGSYFRAVTTSFGSLCFGSLLVALVQTARELLSRLTRSSSRRSRSNMFNEVFLCLAGKLLQWLEAMLVYFNKYSYCYVSAYGLSFLESGKRVTDLFYNRGWTAIINDNLISTALSMFVMAFSLTMTAIGYLLSHDGGGALLPAAGGLVGLVVAVTVAGAVESGVAMVFVCLADDASALHDNHPTEYESLSRSWSLFNAGVVDWRPSASALESRGQLYAPSASPSVPLLATTGVAIGYKDQSCAMEALPPQYAPSAPPAYL